MSAAAAGDRLGGGDALLWGGAAVLAALAHAGLAAWALREPDVLALAAAAPAVMIDLAPAVKAPPAEEEQVAPDTVEAPEVEADAPARTLAAPPELSSPPEAVAEAPLPEPPPPVPGPPSSVALADVPPPLEPLPELPRQPDDRPAARPPDLRVVRREPPPEPPDPKAEPPAPSRGALRAQTRAPTAPRATAPENASGSRGAVSPAKWQSRLMAHLERRKRYPAGARRRGEEGVVHVRFAIDDRGNVGSVRLVRSSGSAELDEAVVALVRRASPVPAPPPGAPRDITAPVRFDIR